MTYFMLTDIRKGDLHYANRHLLLRKLLVSDTSPVWVGEIYFYFKRDIPKEEYLGREYFFLSPEIDWIEVPDPCIRGKEVNVHISRICLFYDLFLPVSRAELNLSLRGLTP
jgi:hypothetical protein